MRQGQPPAEAARIAIERIIEHYADFEGAVVTVSKDGMVGKYHLPHIFLRPCSLWD
jgi:hypothetical protein